MPAAGFPAGFPRSSTENGRDTIPVHNLWKYIFRPNPNPPTTRPANRRNVQNSTGPKTEAGKNASKFNALRHNLTGQVTTMIDEDRAAYDKL